jgi:hypothetical protein
MQAIKELKLLLLELLLNNVIVLKYDYIMGSLEKFQS